MAGLKQKKETCFYEVKIYSETGGSYVIMLTNDNLCGKSLSAWIEENIDFVDRFEIVTEVGKPNARYITREKRKIYLSDADEKNLEKQKNISDAEELIENHSDECVSYAPDDETLLLLGEEYNKMQTKRIDYDQETDLLRRFGLIFDQNNEDDESEDPYADYEFDEESNSYKKRKATRESYYDDYENEDY